MEKKNIIFLLILVFVGTVLLFFTSSFKVISYKTTQEDEKVIVTNCEKITDYNDRTKCLAKILDDTMQQNGIEEGFSLLSNLLKSDSQFEPSCHTLTHNIGAKAYDLFSEHKDFNLGTDSTLCGYGFYHGFTESLALKGGTIQQARDFCAFVINKLKTQLSDIEGQCYHGFGHGSVDILDPTLWGNEIAMITPAIKLCTQVAQNSEQLFRCGTGIFDSISISYFTHKNNIEMKPNDPFWLCDKQSTKEFKSSCYVSMDPALLLMVNLDFPKAAKFVEGIKSDSDAELTMGSLALPLFWIENQRNKQDSISMEEYYKNKGVAECNTLQNRLRLPCIQTIASALSINENATSQYKEGLAFCRSTSLQEDEKSVCLSAVWHSIRVMFTSEKIATICENEALPNEKKYCES